MKATSAISPLLVAAVALILCVFGSRAAEQTKKVKVAPYLRIDESTNKVELQIALRKMVFAEKAKPVIWLAAVSHIGSTNYYQTLQKHLAEHDLVFFEAVLPERKGGWTGKQFSGIRARLNELENKGIQTDLAHALDLAFQLEAIDYDRANYRNSDLSIEAIQKLMFKGPGELVESKPKKGEENKSRNNDSEESEEVVGNESFDQLMSMMQGQGFLGGLVKFGVSIIAANPRLQAVTKLTFIEVLGGLKGDIAQTKAVPPDFAELLKVLIHSRNQKVADDLRKAVRRENPPASISVFYGAGHMDDLERRIRDQLGYEPKEDIWLPAFGVDLEAAGIGEFERQMIKFMTERQLQMLAPTDE